MSEEKAGTTTGEKAAPAPNVQNQAEIEGDGGREHGEQRCSEGEGPKGVELAASSNGAGWPEKAKQLNLYFIIIIND